MFGRAGSMTRLSYIDARLAALIGARKNARYG